jgi:integrase
LVNGKPPKNGERCPIEEANAEMEPNRNITTVPPKSAERLTEKQKTDYREYRKKLLTYLLRVGKNIEKAEGYSPYSVYTTGNRLARFDRWVWERNDGYKIPPTEEDAQAYMEEVAFRDVTESTKGKIMEALLRYSKWLNYKFDRDEWEFSWTFQSGGSNEGFRDFLTKEERHEIRQAALEMKEGWKFTSIIWTALDAALRPVEVGRARTSWVDVENGVLRIPREESSKNVGDWTVGLTDRTAEALEHWLAEREEQEEYNNTNNLWLTREGNRYGAKELSRILRRLCDDADIPHEDRSMSFYAIRHSTGTYMTKERDLAATKAQLRHRDVKTTMKYDQVPVEDRKDALDKMG